MDGHSTPRRSARERRFLPEVDRVQTGVRKAHRRVLARTRKHSCPRAPTLGQIRLFLYIRCFRQLPTRCGKVLRRCRRRIQR
ncbi:UNVERIFIED_CONTAM: hypothetical protein GTU68_038872 [Idotea baltica]|nr:hypothetical protein [Idotea baltica]